MLPGLSRNGPLDSQRAKLFIHLSTHPSVRPFDRAFVYSFIPFVPTFVRSIMYACIHLCTFLQKSVELPVQRKRFMSMAFFEIQ